MAINPLQPTLTGQTFPAMLLCNDCKLSVPQLLISQLFSTAARQSWSCSLPGCVLELLELGRGSMQSILCTTGWHSCEMVGHYRQPWWWNSLWMSLFPTALSRRSYSSPFPTISPITLALPERQPLHTLLPQVCITQSCLVPGSRPKPFLPCYTWSTMSLCLSDTFACLVASDVDYFLSWWGWGQLGLQMDHSTLLASSPVLLWHSYSPLRDWKCYRFTMLLRHEVTWGVEGAQIAYSRASTCQGLWFCQCSDGILPELI